MKQHGLLSQMDEYVLLCAKSKPGSTGVQIRGRIIEVTGEHVSIGAIYSSLHRCSELGYLNAVELPPTSAPGGRSKTAYTITDEGWAALNRASTHRFRLG